MACVHPRRAYLSAEGGRPSFYEKRGFDMPVDLPCGQCGLCRLARRRDWITRCSMELACHSISSFVTLTYNDDTLPPHGSLRYRDVQLFLKRLRRSGAALRYYGSTEYGPNTLRPHYHSIFFGYWPEDARVHSRSDSSFLSRTLSEAWGLGHAYLQPASGGNIAYLAAHNADKLDGEKLVQSLSRVSPHTGEIVEVEAPRGFMSRNPGIGVPFIKKFPSDLLSSADGYTSYGGVVTPIPRLIADKLYELDPALACEREFKRFQFSQTDEALYNATTERLIVIEKVKLAKLAFRRSVKL